MLEGPAPPCRRLGPPLARESSLGLESNGGVPCVSGNVQRGSGELVNSSISPGAQHERNRSKVAARNVDGDCAGVGRLRRFARWRSGSGRNARARQREGRRVGPGRQERSRCQHPPRKHRHRGLAEEPRRRFLGTGALAAPGSPVRRRRRDQPPEPEVSPEREGQDVHALRSGRGAGSRASPRCPRELRNPTHPFRSSPEWFLRLRDGRGLHLPGLRLLHGRALRERFLPGGRRLSERLRAAPAAGETFTVSPPAMRDLNFAAAEVYAINTCVPATCRMDSATAAPKGYCFRRATRAARSRGTTATVRTTAAPTRPRTAVAAPTAFGRRRQVPSSAPSSSASPSDRPRAAVPTEGAVTSSAGEPA